MLSKPWAITAIAFAFTVVSLTLTNPTQEEYEAFAVEQAKGYLKAEVCPEKLPLIGRALEEECQAFLDSEAAQPQLRAVIARATQRHNFVLFSLYETELAINNLFPLIPSGLLPAYEIKSVGLARSLHIYGADSL